MCRYPKNIMKNYLYYLTQQNRLYWGRENQTLLCIVLTEMLSSPTFLMEDTVSDSVKPDHLYPMDKPVP